MNSRIRNYVWWGILVIIPLGWLILGLPYFSTNELAGLHTAEAVGGTMGIWLALGSSILNLIFGKEEYECEKCKLRFANLKEAKKHDRMCKR